MHGHAIPLVPYQSVCGGCPAERTDTWEPLVHGGRGACQLLCVNLPARTQAPPDWPARYAHAFVRQGVLFRQRVDEHGRAALLDAGGPGCLVPLEVPHDGARASAVAFAATDAQLCMVPHDAIDFVASRGGELVYDLLSLQSAAMARVEQLAHARAQKDALGATAALLLALSATLAPPMQLEVLPPGIQQRDLAALLGLRHETISRTLSTLEKRGAISRGPEGIRLLSRADLAAGDGG